MNYFALRRVAIRISANRQMVSMDVSNAIESRFSARSFLSQPVTRKTVEEILRIASQAPSGANMQPWRVYALSGEPLDRLIEASMDSMKRGIEEPSEYPLYPHPLPDPYSSRRFDAGMELYKALGIDRVDKAARNKQLLENFRFFGAPVGLIVTLDKIFVPGQVGDLGMFLQNIMLLARERNLHTCPQGAWSLVNRTVHRVLEIPDQELIYCGMALGYLDNDHPANSFKLSRIPVNNFTRFSGFEE